MKISNVKIENFRGIATKNISLDDLTIILDDCGKGKTSILNAIIFALTGDVDITDIRNGCIDTTVMVTFEDGSTIERSRDKTGTTCRINGKRTTATAAKEYVNSLTGANVDFLPALLGVNFFENISQRDLSDFFSKVLPCSITFDKMIDLINQDIRKDAKAYLKDEEVAFLKKYFDTNNSFGIEEIDAAYKKAYEERKGAKAVLKNLLPKSEFNGVLPQETKEELEKELANVIEKEMAVKSYDKELLSYEKALQDSETMKTRKKETEIALKTFEKISVPQEEILTTAKEDKRKFENAIRKSQDIKATAEANIKSFQNILNNLNSNHCVACKDIICTTDKSCAKADLEERIAENKKLMKEHEDFIARCEEQIAKREQIIEDYNANAMKYDKKVMLTKQLESYVIPEIPKKPEKPEEMDFVAKKKEINNKLSSLTLYEGTLSAKQECEKLQKKIALLEMTILVLDVKSGVRTVILQKALGVFENLCNAKLSSINTNMEISFRAENGIEVFVKTENSNGFIPMKKVSTGQFVLVAYALMCLIGKVTKCNYCIIDNLDKLDAKSAKEFLSLLSQDDTFDTIVLAGIAHTDLSDICVPYNVIRL